VFFVVGISYFIHCLDGPTNMYVVLIFHLLLNSIVNYVSAGNLIWFCCLAKHVKYFLIHIQICKPLSVSHCISCNSNYVITVLMDFSIISVRNRVDHYWIEIPWMWRRSDNPLTYKRWPTIVILEIIKNLRKKAAVVSFVWNSGIFVIVYSVHPVNLFIDIF
jgi:hypothetical protein